MGLRTGDERPPGREHGDAAKRGRLASSAVFFPAAALYAAFVLPWSVLAMTGLADGPAALATPFGHAHEMLIGYALAVVAGNQLGGMPAWRLRSLLGAWMLARVAFVAFPGPVAAALDAVFVSALGLHLTPRLFRAAKKLRNQALPVILSALCIGAVALDAAAFLQGAVSKQATVTALVLLLAALMLFMGGRIIAPAAAGAFYRQGRSLEARVQPRIEAGIIAAMAVAVVAAVIPALGPLLQLACAAAAALALVRLLRWRLWACAGRRDLLCLGAGYAWLVAGLLFLAITAAGTLRVAALHVVTVGALGTLTLNVMGNTMLARARRNPADDSRLAWGTASIGLATIARVAAALVTTHGTGLLATAAACWSGAFVLLSWLLADARAGRDAWLKSDTARDANRRP